MRTDQNNSKFLSWVALVSLLFVFSSCSKIYFIRNHPEILKGVLDLTSWDKINTKPTQLIGEVEFYWEKLLTPNDFNAAQKPPIDGYIQIPGVWNGYQINKKTLNGNGFATFRFIIKTRSDGIYSLKINEVDCAYKIWVNDALDSAGSVGSTREKMIPSWERKEVYFNTNNKQAEVVIQVSNFHHRKGGLEDAIVFGSAKQIMVLKERSISSDIFLLSVIMLVGISHFFIYLLRKKEKSALLFGILCFVMTLRLISTSEKLIFEVFSNIPWELVIRLEYFSYTIVVPLVVAFLYSYYPKEFSRRALQIITIIAAIFSLSYFVTPVRIFSYTPLYYQVIIVISGIYVLYALTKALKNREDNALIFLGGFIVFFLIVINDILYYNKVINSTLLMPFGLAFMVISQSFALTKKQIKAFTDNELLSAELDKYNRELEVIVVERTSKINHQKEELEAQAENLKVINDRLVELSRFKDSMTGMVVHDMKNHLNNIILLSGKSKVTHAGVLDADETINHSAKQIQTLVMNILDIQRFEEARFELDLQDVILFPTINRVKKDLEIMLRLKGISINNQTSRSLSVKVDPDIIHRVFINLISNAIKFSPSNSEILVKTEDQENKVKFLVIDKGIGVNDSLKDKIFDKFATFDSPSLQNFKSTGIGLTFCKLAVEAHHGKIGVTDGPEKGSIFWFTLPKGNLGKEEIEDSASSKIESNTKILSDYDISILNKYALQLSTIKYYEVTRVNLLLSQIKSELGDNLTVQVESWINEIKESVALSNKDLFDLKIQEVLKRN